MYEVDKNLIIKSQSGDEEALEKLKAWKVDPHDESWMTK